MDAWLIYRGDGMFVTRSRLDRDRLNETLERGEACRCSIKRPRSLPHHRLFFAILNKAHENLSEKQRAWLPSPELLRKYCLCKIGHCDMRHWVADDPAAARDIVRGVKWADGEVFTHLDGCTVTAFRAKSMSFDKMGQDEFAEVFDRVTMVLSELLGVSIDSLLNEADREAA